MKSKGRLIEFHEYVLNGSYWEPGDVKLGRFHQFGSDTTSTETGIGSFTTAVIECEDGTLKNIPVEHCRFVTSEDDE